MIMATPVRELGYGAVEVYSEETLGVGSYGKVCKAKSGQLPCAAKLLHDTMFDTNDPGISKFVERFKQECRFLKAIKHPNIVQFLDSFRDPRSRRLVLLMELMDESLTRFLDRSTGPLPYHTQLIICHDVALALAYLHSNDIIHRDLSSNNVLLIGEGSRAKVSDFGMSKFEGMNPRMTPLTMCPGTTAYMPPEALITPPRYSNKLDCFSHGVLTIQIVTRQFPNPGDAQVTIPDARYPTGKVHVPVPERERRKKDIDLADPNHPLLPFALHCLKDDDTERPSADEICGRLATLKGEQIYTHSVEQSREQSVSVQTLQQQIREMEGELMRARANQQQVKNELERARANCKTALEECHATYQQQIQEKDGELARARASQCDSQRQPEKKDDQLQRLREELNSNESEMKQVIADCRAQVQTHESANEQLRKENRELRQKQEPQKAPQAAPCRKQEPQTMPEEAADECIQLQEWLYVSQSAVQVSTDPVKLTWRRGTPAPEWMCGAAVVHGNTAYFSQGYNVYALSQDKWTELKQCTYKYFSMAVINNQLTTIGGTCDLIIPTNTLLCLSSEMMWEELLPPMPTPRIWSAAVTTPTHLIVAGGKTKLCGDALSVVETLDTNTLQWSSVSSSPKSLGYPNMTLCNGQLYLSEHSKFFSCSVEELIKSRRFVFNWSSVWAKLEDIPVPYWARLTTVRGQVLAIGGSDRQNGGTPTGAIHHYNRSTNSWSVIKEMPTPRARPLVAVLPSHELIVVGGVGCTITEIATSMATY